jgi:hypothetical protein
MSRLYCPQGRRARWAGSILSPLRRPLKSAARALPIPTTIPMIQPATGIAETALRARSIPTLAMAPRSCTGSAETAKGTSASRPAISPLPGRADAIFDQTVPSKSPAIVAFVFQRIWVAWFQAWAPAWLKISSPIVCWPPPSSRCMRLVKAVSARASCPGNGLVKMSGTRSNKRLFGLMSTTSHRSRYTTGSYTPAVFPAFEGKALFFHHR